MAEFGGKIELNGGFGEKAEAWPTPEHESGEGTWAQGQLWTGPTHTRATQEGYLHGEREMRKKSILGSKISDRIESRPETGVNH